MASVVDLLSLPSLDGATIAVGGNGQSKQVLSANVMAVPDIAMWAQPGDFLITTGFIFRDQPHIWGDLVRQLADIGVATLAFKPGRFVEEIPIELLQAAQKYHLPIVWLPEHVIFSRAVFEIVEYILNERTTSDYHLMSLMRLGLDHGLTAVVHEIGRHFNRPLAVLSSRGQILANEGFDDSFLSQWRLGNPMPEKAGGTVKIMTMPEHTTGSTMLLAVGPTSDNQPSHQGDIYIIRNILSVLLVHQEITLSVEQNTAICFSRLVSRSSL